MKQSGQAVIEIIILLPLIASCFILCLLFFHVQAQHLWMDHQLYQSLICIARGKTKLSCETQMKKKIKSFLWTGKLKNIQLYQGKNKWKGSFIWETGFWRIKLKKQINLKRGVLL